MARSLRAFRETRIDWKNVGGLKFGCSNCNLLDKGVGPRSPQGILGMAKQEAWA